MTIHHSLFSLIERAATAASRETTRREERNSETAATSQVLDVSQYVKYNGSLFVVFRTGIDSLTDKQTTEMGEVQVT